MNHKQLKATVEAATDKGIVAKISTESIDRDGEVLIPQGMNSKEFENNPILFWNHDYSIPIGNVKNIERGEGSVYGTLSFAKRTEGVKGEFFPEVAESLVKQGVVKGISVGFVPEDGGVRAATKRDRDQYGSKVKRVFNRWKLLEVSVAPLPANQDALVEAVGKGLLSPIQCKSFFGVDIEEPSHEIRLTSPRRKHKIKLRPPSKTVVVVDNKSAVRKSIAKLRGQIYL